jgi:hypothetical protein
MCVQISVTRSSPPPPPASKPRSSIRAGASRKLGLKHASKFRKCASGLLSTLPAISEASPSASKFLKRASEGTSHVLPRKARALPRGNEVFWCAVEGYFAFLVLFKEVPTPSISPTLVINGNEMKKCHFFIFILLTLPLIVSGCLRVVPTSLDFIWKK